MTDPAHTSDEVVEPAAFPSRLVVVSNRLPVRLVQRDGQWQVRPGSGGLVTALEPVLARHQGSWIGWVGVAEGPENQGVDWHALLAEAARESSYDLGAVPLEPEEVELYYEGFANAIVWPLFHDRVGDCDFDRRYWSAYLDVNRKFMHAVLDRTGADDLIWVHDYHLFHLGCLLRVHRPRQPMGFFLHIPFPPPDLFVRIPWWEELLTALLAYDRVAVQTRRDLRNLRMCLQRLLPDTQVRGRAGGVQVVRGDRSVLLEYHPIGIDSEGWVQASRSPRVEEKTRELLRGLGGAAMILGVDRLDYTKGLLERLDAYELLLERHPELHARTALVQLVVPSREGVARYQTLKSELERKVGAINGRFGTPAWTPVRYLYRGVSRESLMALYRAARVCIVTSLKDGMNLVAKEFCACQRDEPGALVLSRFAGAASQLKVGALLVNPHDVSSTAKTLARALEMPLPERARRMRLMQDTVEQHDVHWWVRRCLAGLQRDAGTTAIPAAK